MVIEETKMRISCTDLSWTLHSSCAIIVDGLFANVIIGLPFLKAHGLLIDCDNKM